MVGADWSGYGWRVVFEETSAEAAFAASLKQARTLMGLTQAEVAEEMSKRGFKWHPPTVYKVENGERQIQLGEALELARILNRSVDDMAKPETDAQRRQDILVLYGDVVSAASGIISEIATFRIAVVKLQVVLDATPHLEELFAPADVELIRWYANSEWTHTMQELRYEPPVFGDPKMVF